MRAYIDLRGAQSRIGVLLRDPNTTRSRIERELNGGRSFKNSIEADGLQAAEHLDPATGARYRFLFSGERLVTYRIAGFAAPPPPASWRWAEGVRQYVAATGLGLWLLVLLLLLLGTRRRRLMADVLLAVTLVCTAAWLLLPAGETPWALPEVLVGTWRGRSMPGWFRLLCWSSPVGLMLLVLILTLFIFFTIRRRTAMGFPHCARCGYNLILNTTGICPECGLATDIGLRSPDSTAAFWSRLPAGLLHITAGVCLIGIGLTLFLWVRSTNRWDWMDWGTRSFHMKAHSADGQAECRLTIPGGAVRWEYGSTRVTRVEVAEPSSWFEARGFALRKTSRSGILTITLAAPHWFFLLVASIPPACWCRRHMRRHRQPPATGNQQRPRFVTRLLRRHTSGSSAGASQE